MARLGLRRDSGSTRASSRSTSGSYDSCSALTMGELRKPLAGLSPDTARSVQPKPPQVLRSDVAGSLLPGGFSHGHGGVRGRPNNPARSTSISRFILTSPSAPLSWFSLCSMVSGHHQMDHEVARGRYPRSDFRRTGRRRCEAGYFPESSSVSDSGGGGCPSDECASVVHSEGRPSTAPGLCGIL